MIHTDVAPPEDDLTPIPPPLVAVRCSRVLAWGFRVSAALILIGIARGLFDRQPLDSHLPSPAELVTGMRTATPGSFLALGIIAMILIPLVSSLTIAVTFFQGKDARYGRFTLLVLVILGLSLSLSLR